MKFPNLKDKLADSIRDYRLKKKEEKEFRAELAKETAQIRRQEYKKTYIEQAGKEARLKAKLEAKRKYGVKQQMNFGSYDTGLTQPKIRQRLNPKVSTGKTVYIEGIKVSTRPSKKKRLKITNAKPKNDDFDKLFWGV